MGHVTFIHGIGNKLAADALLDGWERSLAVDDGLDLGTMGITSEMVYWADVLYPGPKEESFESVSDLPEVDDTDQPSLVGADAREQDWLDRFASGLGLDEDGPETVAADAEAAVTQDDGLERVPLPRFVKNQVLRTLLRDVHHYLFNSSHEPRTGIEYRVQDEIRARMLDALEQGSEEEGPHVVVSHSMGTVIAYDCLKRAPSCPPVDALVTLGSPLGRHEIPDELKPGWSRNDGFPERVRDRWVNVFDRLDPVVGMYPHLKYLYRRRGSERVVDVNEQNWGTWRHDIAKYLHGDELRAHLAQLLGVPTSR